MIINNLVYKIFCSGLALDKQCLAVKNNNTKLGFYEKNLYYVIGHSPPRRAQQKSSIFY